MNIVGKKHGCTKMIKSTIFCNFMVSRDITYLGSVSFELLVCLLQMCGRIVAHKISYTV